MQIEESRGHRAGTLQYSEGTESKEKIPRTLRMNRVSWEQNQKGVMSGKTRKEDAERRRRPAE